MIYKQMFHKATELGIGITTIGVLVLTGCGGAFTSSATTSDLTVTPMKGKFANGTTVLVKLAKDMSLVASGVVGSNGSASIKVPNSATGPFLIEAGLGGDSYFDESTGTSATIPAGSIGLRALVPDATSARTVGVTALTEIAVGTIEGASGIAAATANTVLAANASIGNQYGVTDPLAPPSLIDSGSKFTGDTTADNYALVLAGLAKMAAPGVSALKAIQDMRDDAKDGTVDGRVGTTPLTSLNRDFPIALKF